MEFQFPENQGFQHRRHAFTVRSGLSVWLCFLCDFPGKWSPFCVGGFCSYNPFSQENSGGIFLSLLYSLLVWFFLSCKRLSIPSCINCSNMASILSLKLVFIKLKTEWKDIYVTQMKISIQKHVEGIWMGACILLGVVQAITSLPESGQMIPKS